ncbi:MAG: DNA packaging protein [bacterium]|nr:DNA packaging protein [bacterium]
MRKVHSSASNSGRIGEPLQLSKSGFAKKVGITPGRVSQLIRKGLPVDDDGKIDVARGRLWIAENVNPIRAAAQKQESLPLGDERQQATLTSERIRLASEQADAASLKNARLRGELVPAIEVENEWAAILRKVRAGVMAVPSRIRQQLPHLTAHDIELIDGELRQALEGLAVDQ